jgi:diacylglycerol kinase
MISWIYNFLLSVRCASNGILYAVKTERNIRVHLYIFALMLLVCLLLRIAKMELLIILGMSALMISLELVNTAIERMADIVSPEFNAQIGLVKDIMAGAVLVTSIFAVIIWLVILFEPLKHLFQK